MLNPHVSVGIAQICFYVPMLPVAIYILVKNWNFPPRMAWIPLVTFSVLRIAGGALAIARGNDFNNDKLIIAEMVILGVGTVPLIVALIGFLRIIFIMSVPVTSRSNQILRILHMLFTASVILLIAGGVLTSSASSEGTGRTLSRAAYILLAVLLLLSTGGFLYLASLGSQVPPHGFHYIYFCLLAVPFIAVRIAYGILSAFTDFTSQWDPVFGSPVIFALMGLLMEFIALCIYVHLGFYTIKKTRDGTHLPGRDDSQFWGRRGRRNRRVGMGWAGSSAEYEQPTSYDAQKPPIV